MSTPTVNHAWHLRIILGPVPCGGCDVAVVWAWTEGTKGKGGKTRTWRDPTTGLIHRCPNARLR